MLESLLAEVMSWYQQLLVITKDNPIVGSAVFVTLAGMSYQLMKYHVLKFPGYVKNVFLRLFTVTTLYKYPITGCSVDSDDAHKFLTWYLKSRWGHLCRDYKVYVSWLQSREQRENQPANGFYLFWYQGSLGSIYRFETTDGQIVNTNIFIRLWGSNKKLNELLQKSRDDYDNSLRKSGILVKTENRDGWGTAGTIRFRTADTLTYSDNVFERLCEILSNFKSREEWYTRMGIPYKLVIVLEGPPGTGKTSLIKALATQFQKKLGVLNINAQSDESIANYLTTADEDMFVIIEDFDSSDSTKTRIPIKAKSDNEILEPLETTVPIPPKIETSLSRMFGLSITGILNALDGLMTPHGSIIILTTNHINKIDPAIIRPGRCDAVVHVGLLKDPDIRSYVKRAFPDLVLPMNVVYAPISGASLQELVMTHLNTPDNLIPVIPVLDEVNDTAKRVVGLVM